MKQLQIISRITLHGLAVLFFMTVFHSKSNAGSVVGELEYRYPCSTDEYRIQVRPGSGRSRASAAIQLDSEGYPEIVLNERGSWELPRVLIAFEYFSACALAREIILMLYEGESVDLRDVDLMRPLVFRSDCNAIYRLDEEGLLRGNEDASAIMEVFYYERSRDRYLGIGFPERADFIQHTCPI